MLVACSGTDYEDQNRLVETVDVSELLVVIGGNFGDPLPRLTDAQLALFDEGVDGFAEVEDADEGLGPVFNDASCAACHTAGAVGGASDRFVTRFGRVENGVFDPLAELGGSLIQVNGIGDVGTGFEFVGETVPETANRQTHRVTTPLFGAGLIDHLPDEVIEGLARAEALISPATAGRPNHVTNLITGGTSVGKFGWKAQVPLIAQFSADAYLNEMGITSPLLPAENCPQGNCDLLAFDPTPDPEDDGEDTDKFTAFMTFLGPPSRGTITNAARRGAFAFLEVGCANCHTPVLFTGHSDVEVFDNAIFFPFSDFLLHDMGSLGDGITQAEAGGTDMRTAPLWGVRVRPVLLHDGRATNVREAINAHDGQGARARDNFQYLSESRQRDLVAFVNSL